ncbi:MAG: ribosomal protein S18-alanine N-acetyltransferase [Chloroflexota bacterium]
MAYLVRLMRKEDVPQVSAIDREAFPGWLPYTNYERELDNRLAHFIVACDTSTTNDALDSNPSEENSLRRLTAKVRGLFSHNADDSKQDKIVGFAGFWIAAGEAHVMSIAVREAYRRRGIGELMLIRIIDMATELKADFIALEARISNLAAQSLYLKYGFIERDIRPGYYSDNREDAVYMTTDSIQTVPFQSHLKKLKKLYDQKWGTQATQSTVEKSGCPGNLPL